MIAHPTLELPQPAYCTKPLAQCRKAVTSIFVTLGISEPAAQALTMGNAAASNMKAGSLFMQRRASLRLATSI